LLVPLSYYKARRDNKTRGKAAMEKRMRKVCAKCGINEHASEFVGPFCPACASETASATLANRIEVDECPRCKRIRRATEYFEPSNDELASLAASKIKGSADIVGAKLHCKPRAGRSLQCSLDCVLSCDGKEFPKAFDFEFFFQTELCDRCNKIASGYHEGILQLRGDSARVEKAAEKFRQELGGDIVTKEKKIGGGIDLFISERDVMMKLVMSVHRPYTATRKLKGVKKGRHHFITTVCMRFFSQPASRAPKRADKGETDDTEAYEEERDEPE
jgi:NMD protein affecting ribosome stability and mRNA decay